MDKFRNKYRIASARLKKWDYGWNAMYYITICTRNRECCFGEIINDQMHYSEIGKIVEDEWQKTFDLRKDMNLFEGEFIVMPNHLHAIIGIGENKFNRVNHQIDYKNKFGPQSKNLSSIVRGFKSAVTVSARVINPGFNWQPRFHDHIIRNEESFQRISNYIIDNTANWKDDEYNT